VMIDCRKSATKETEKQYLLLMRRIETDKKIELIKRSKWECGCGDQERNVQQRKRLGVVKHEEKTAVRCGQLVE
jgi:hypothetical protein